MNEDMKDRKIERIFDRLSYLYSKDELSIDDIEKLDKFLHRNAGKVQERSIEVIVHDEYGTVERYRIFPDSVCQRDNGVVEETYTFKLFTREYSQEKVDLE